MNVLIDTKLTRTLQKKNCNFACDVINGTSSEPHNFWLRISLISGLFFKVTDNDGTKLTLTWDHLGHSSYFIVEYRNLDFENEQFSADSEASSLRLENLRIGTDYNFRVWAVFIDFNSSGYASLDYQVPCELKQDKWSDGTHGELE